MSFLIVVLAYVFCHGITALVVTPIQGILLPELTVFASLVYLPHGVRVLATWAFGWKAIPALVVGTGISAWIFRPAEDWALIEPVLLQGILVGSVSAFMAFELARLLGFNLYFGGTRRLKWKGMILIGTISSIINSIGQTLVHSGFVGLDQLPELLIIYATGDLIGLVTCIIALMFVFRWSRLPKRT